MLKRKENINVNKSIRYVKFAPLLVILSLAFMLSSVIADDTAPTAKEERVKAGKALFETKKCSHCHTMEDGEKKDEITDLRKWKELASPTIWAAIMWNHVPEMVKSFKEENIVFPEFEGEELAYVFEYIHSFSEEKHSHKFTGDKDRGKYLFKFLGCKKCHVVKGKSNDKGPNLKDISKNIDNDREFATQMLAHVPHMCKTAKKQKLYWPVLQGNEVAHLYAYFKYISEKK